MTIQLPNNKRLLTSAILLILVIFSCPVANAQLTTDSGVSPQQAVEILSGEGILISNVQFSGAPEQVGSFNCNDCGLDLEDGIVLATGNVNVVEGPNSTGSASQGNFNIDESDPDLETLVPDGNFHDAAVLEFDFIAASDSASFEFVFGSEEYPEYVGTINDAFGFFVSGPGINGPYSNSAINVALVPGTDTPISISTINNGVDGVSGPCENCEYYINNTSELPSYNNVQFDGFTTVLKAEAGGLQCGETYHIKLAIADNADASYDSGIFLKGNSLYSEVTDQTNISDLLDSSSLMEGCSSISYPVFNSDISQEDTIFISTGGTAENGIDFTELPEFIILDSAVCFDVVTVEALSDTISESTESLIFQLLNPNESGEIDTLVNEEFDILNYVPPSFQLQDSLSFCYGDEIELEPIINSGIGVYDLTWSTGDSALSIIVSPLEEENYIFSMVDPCGSSETDSITVTPLILEILVTQEMHTLTSVENGVDYEWLDCNNEMQPIEGENDQSFVATENGSYAVSLTLGGCTEVSECHTITGIVSVGENGDKRSPKIYPNPTKGDITLEYGKEINDYQLVDFTGRVILKGQMELGTKILDLELPQSPGVYFLRVNSMDGSAEVLRVVKK